MPPGVREFRVTQAFAARLGCFQGSRCPRADDLALVLGNSRQDVDRQFIGVRIVNGNELHTGVHQGRDEG
jgi:hypothetical protein